MLYNDPHIPVIELGGKSVRSTALTDKILRQADCVAIITDHSEYNFADIVPKAKLIIDTRNAAGSLKKYSHKIVKL